MLEELTKIFLNTFPHYVCCCTSFKWTLFSEVTFVQKMLLPSHLKCISKHYNCTDIVQCSAVYIYIYVCLSHLHVHRSVHCHWAFLQAHLPPQLLSLLHTHLTNWLQAIGAIGSVDHTIIQDWLSLPILVQDLCVNFKKSDHIHPILQTLHWLPATLCIQYKISTMFQFHLWHIPSVWSPSTPHSHFFPVHSPSFIPNPLPYLLTVNFG